MDKHLLVASRKKFVLIIIFKKSLIYLVLPRVIDRLCKIDHCSNFWLVERGTDIERRRASLYNVATLHLVAFKPWVLKNLEFLKNFQFLKPRVLKNVEFFYWPFKNLLFFNWPVKNLLFSYWWNKTCGFLIGS